MKNGQWKLNSITPALVASSGLVFLKDKKPKGLTLSNILEMIREHPSQSYYYKTIPRRVTLAEAIEDGELDKLGKMRNTYSSIDLILLSPEREFESLPKTGGQLLSKHYKGKPKEVKE